MIQIRNLIAAAVFAVASGPVLLNAQSLTPPAVPGDLVVPEGNTLFLKGAARGTQNYICLPAATSFAWTFFSPQATLFFTFQFFGSEVQQQIVTHFLSPNPDEDGLGRATWQSSLDTSRVWAKVRKPSTDANFVAPGAIPWLLLEKAGRSAGPNGGEILSNTTFIQRVNTAGGIAPSTGCASAADVGATALVPYTADYYFYRATPKY